MFPLPNREGTILRAASGPNSRDLHSSTVRLDVSIHCGIRWVQCVVSVTKTAQVELRSGRVREWKPLQVGYSWRRVEEEAEEEVQRRSSACSQQPPCPTFPPPQPSPATSGWRAAHLPGYGRAYNGSPLGRRSGASQPRTAAAWRRPARRRRRASSQCRTKHSREPAPCLRVSAQRVYFT